MERMKDYAFDLDDESVKWNIHTFPLPDVFKAGSDEWAGREHIDLFGIRPSLGLHFHTWSTIGSRAVRSSAG